MTNQFSNELMQNICNEFKENNKGYFLSWRHTQGGCDCGIYYNVDQYFFETVTEKEFTTPSELTDWIAKKSALCTNERLLNAYERQLRNIQTGNTAHDFDGNIFEKNERTRWLNEHISKLKGESEE